MCSSLPDGTHLYYTGILGYTEAVVEMNLILAMLHQMYRGQEITCICIVMCIYIHVRGSRAEHHARQLGDVTILFGSIPHESIIVVSQNIGAIKQAEVFLIKFVT